jgi:hypothetical protein
MYIWKEKGLKHLTEFFIILFIALIISGSSQKIDISEAARSLQIRDTESGVKEFVLGRSQYGDFVLWENESIDFRKELKSSGGKVTAHLYNITDRNKVIGYVIISPYTLDIIEYALGLSIYDAYLMYHNLMDMDKDMVFVYDGPSHYGISLKAQGKRFKSIAITSENIRGFNPMSDVVKLAKEKNIRIIGNHPYVWDMYKGSVTTEGQESSENRSLGLLTEKVLLNVPDFQRYIGCGPTTGANIVYYLDKRYNRLVEDGEKPEYVIKDLSSRMYTTLTATLPTDFRDGLKAYLNSSARYPNRFDVYWYPDLSGRKTYETICQEVKNGRTGALLYLGSPMWGNHYVNFTGFSKVTTTKGTSNYYIIHDNWDATPRDVYRNWFIDEPFIESIFVIADNHIEEQEDL